MMTTSASSDDAAALGAANPRRATRDALDERHLDRAAGTRATGAPRTDEADMMRASVLRSEARMPATRPEDDARRKSTARGCECRPRTRALVWRRDTWPTTNHFER
jgi:hypothetical protein